MTTVDRGPRRGSPVPRVVVVVPTYNEAANIRPLLDQLLALACRPDVLVVDGNSPDGTATLVEAMRATNPRVMLQRRTGKDGLAAAYRAGFHFALGLNRYDVIIQMDADFSHAPSDVDRLAAATDGADLVIGSRYVPGGAVRGWSFWRRWLSRAGNAYARAWLSSPVRDLTCGFKAWRSPTLAALPFGSVQSDGYAFQVETTVRAAVAGARVVEVPITFVDRKHGVSKMTPGIALEALWVVPTLRQRQV